MRKCVGQTRNSLFEKWWTGTRNAEEARTADNGQKRSFLGDSYVEGV
jgi:hypothetical protein